MDLQRLLAGAKARLSAFTAPQLVIIGLLTVVGVVAVGAFLRWVTAPSYDVLLAGLDPADAAAVTEQLESSGVPYELAAGGSTVLVPSAQLQAQRLAVAAAGLPEGQSKGYELLDEQGMTASSFQQRIAYQRALEGELARTLEGMKEVRSATVHLALPEEELYTDEKKPAQASVLLETAGTLPDDGVESVQRLVASSVPDLEPEAVTVSDTKGRLLSDEDGTAGGSGRLEAEQSAEDAAVTRADSMLASVLGPGRAVVRVNAELDTAERSTESETYDPQRTAVLRKQTAKEDYDAANGAIGGVVSVPEPGQEGADDGRSRYLKDESSEEYGVSREVQRVTEAPGGLKRLSVAVMVDENAIGLPSDQVISDLVANAVGVDAARGDTITVAAVPFAEAEEPEEPVVTQDWTTYAGTGAAVLVLLGIGFAFLRAMRRDRVDEVPLDELEPAEELPAVQAAAVAAAAAAPRLAAAAPDRTSELQVLELVDSRPDEVTALIRSWLSEPAEGGKR